MGNDFRAEFLGKVERSPLLIVYDCETTGLNPEENHIIELSATLLLDDGNGGYEPLDSQIWYINPGYPLPAIITELTGITDEFLSDKPSEKEVIDDIESYFSSLPVCGYNNITFDDIFMENMYRRHGKSFDPEYSLDVYTMTPRLINPEEVKNYKLATLAVHYGLASDDDNFHDASFDTKCTWKLLNKIIELARSKEPTYDNLIKCMVTDVSYWSGRFGDNFYSRVYVETSRGTFYFDTARKQWHTKNPKDTVDRYDLNHIRDQVLSLTGTETEDELSLYRGNIKTNVAS